MRMVVSVGLALLVTACAPSPPAAAVPSPSTGPPAVTASLSGSPTPATSPSATAAPFSATLSGPIQRLDAQVGFATTQTGLIRTEDGGLNWTALARMDGAFFSELRFVDAAHGWAIVQRHAPTTICVSPKTPPPCWTVLTTDDGGTTWADRLSAPGNQIGTAVITSLQAIDGQRAWVVIQTKACAVMGCIGEVRATRDGGRTWTTQLSREGGLGPLRFASASRGWIAAARPGDGRGGSDVLATPDGGVTWTTVYRASTGVIAIDAASEREAWILTRDGGYCTASNCSRYELLHSADGGTTWGSFGDPKEQATCSGGHLSGPVFASPSVGWMGISLGAGGANVGSGGLMRTSDGGRSWDCRTTPQNGRYSSAADPRRVWVRSDPNASSLKGAAPALMATEDGGDTWHLVPIVIRLRR